MSELTIIRDHVHPTGAKRTRVPLVADRATLTKRRWRGQAKDGREFGFDLEHPLKHHDAFFVEDDRVYFLEQAPETVLEIPFRGGENAAHLAWNLGNLHFPVQVTPEAVRVTDDPAVRQWLQRENVAHHAVTCVFLPLSNQHGHFHSHAHSHSHGHSHSHE